MGVMTFLRERAGLLMIGLIGLSIVAFLVSDASRMGGSLFRDNGTTIGIVGGEKISEAEFNTKLQLQVEQAKQQYGQSSLPPQMMGYVNEQTWNQVVTQMILTTQINKAGLQTSSAELSDLILGRNPDARVKQAFTDPKTGTFDPSSVRNFLRNLDRNADTKKRWLDLEKEISDTHALQKYVTLIQGGVYVTSLEINTAYSLPEKVGIKYALLDYSRIADNKVALTDNDLNTYYNDNIYKYQSKENTVSIDFVTLAAKPSAEDSSNAKKDIDKAIADFKTTKSDSLFVSLNSDSKLPVRFFKKGQLSAKLDSNLKNASVGTVYGPYFENGSFKAAKLLAIKDMPDSVRSRHILLAPQGNENIQTLTKRADSIKSLLAKGASFAELASKFSADKGSAVKGGELGFIALGSLVKPFEDFIFNGKKGQTSIVTTQYGVHIVEIEDQKNISKAMQVAQIDRSFSPSSKTVQNSYSKATSFLGSLDAKDPQTLAVQARKIGTIVHSAEDIKGNDQSLQGLDNARKVVQWAFGKKPGDLSEVFDLGNNFVVARLVSTRKKGAIPFEQVKRVVSADALKARKGDLLSTQLSDAQKSVPNLDGLAQKLGLTAVTTDSLSFENGAIGQNIEEPKLVGAAFGSALNKIGKPVIGDRGVYAFEVVAIHRLNITAGKTGNERIRSTFKSQAAGSAIEALKNAANIQDNRSKFF